MQKRKPIRFFALAVVWLAVPFVFFSESGVSLGHFLLFLIGGLAAGVSLCSGIHMLRAQGKGEQTHTKP